MKRKLWVWGVVLALVCFACFSVVAFQIGGEYYAGDLPAHDEGWFPSDGTPYDALSKIDTRYLLGATGDIHAYTLSEIDHVEETLHEVIDEEVLEAVPYEDVPWEEGAEVNWTYLTVLGGDFAVTSYVIIHFYILD